jgi:hypothetical protein
VWPRTGIVENDLSFLYIFELCSWCHHKVLFNIRKLISIFRRILNIFYSAYLQLPSTAEAYLADSRERVLFHPWVWEMSKNPLPRKLRVRWRILLHVTLWTGLNWLGIEFNNWFYEHGNLRSGSKRRGNFLTSWANISIWRRSVRHGVKAGRYKGARQHWDVGWTCNRNKYVCTCSEKKKWMRHGLTPFEVTVVFTKPHVANSGIVGIRNFYIF